MSYAYLLFSLHCVPFYFCLQMSYLSVIYYLRPLFFLLFYCVPIPFILFPGSLTIKHLPPLPHFLLSTFTILPSPSHTRGDQQIPSYIVPSPLQSSSSSQTPIDFLTSIYKKYLACKHCIGFSRRNLPRLPSLYGIFIDGYLHFVNIIIVVQFSGLR